MIDRIFSTDLDVIPQGANAVVLKLRSPAVGQPGKDGKDGKAGATGPRGLAGVGSSGPAGPIGPAGENTITYPAGEIIGSPRVVMMVGGELFLFDPTIEANAERFIGVSINAAIIGDPVTAVFAGDLASPGAFIADAIYYAGPNGTLTSTIPTSGVLVKIGIASTTGNIIVEMSDPVIIANTPASTLLAKITSYWNMDEASNVTRADAVASEDLTDNASSVAAVAGKINNGGEYTDISSKYLKRSSDSTLQTGDVDFEFTAWVKLAAKTDYMMIVTKDGAIAGQREYLLYYDQGADRFTFQVFKATDSAQSVSSGSSPSAGVWYFIDCWHDAATDTLNIMVDNADLQSTGYAGTLQAASNGEFRIGSTANGGFEMEGVIDEVGFWKTLLTTPERILLYNAGVGLSYPF